MTSLDVRIGIGVDAHRLVEGKPLVLGGEPIAHAKGLEGHSDGDVVLHALSDALLGAVAGPDIGALFPSSEAKWRGAASRIFLERARAIVEEKGYRVRQVDIVVIASEPRLSSHVGRIRSRLAALLDIPEDAVGFKATTTDGMGFTGRGEGIAAQAVATLGR